MFSYAICDDLQSKLQTKFNIPNPTNDEVTDYGLFLVNDMHLQVGKTLVDFVSMPLPVKDWSPIIGNKLI